MIGYRSIGRKLAMNKVRHQIFKVCQANVFARYGVAAILAATAAFITRLMPVHDTAFYSFFLAAIAGCGILAGWKSSLLCTVLSAVISDFFFVQPTYTFGFADSEELSRFLGFTAAALLICFMSALLNTSEVTLTKVYTKAQTAEDALARNSNERELLERSAKFWLFEINIERDVVQWTDVYNGIRVARTQPFQSWLEQVHPDDRQRVRNAIYDALISGEFESKFRFYVRQGEDSPRSVLARARVVVRDGKSIILRGINVDLNTSEPETGVAPVSA